MHIPVATPSCSGQTMNRPWTMLDKALHSRKRPMENPVGLCRAFRDEDQMRALQGDVCISCPRNPYVKER